MPGLGLGPGRNVPLQGRQGYRGRIPVSPGGSHLVSSGSKGKKTVSSILQNHSLTSASSPATSLGRCTSLSLQHWVLAFLNTLDSRVRLPGLGSQPCYSKLLASCAFSDKRTAPSPATPPNAHWTYGSGGHKQEVPCPLPAQSGCSILPALL